MKSAARTLLVGWAVQDITPAPPVELFGQYYQRLARAVRDPLQAVAWALESPRGSARPEQAIFVGLDVCAIDRRLLAELRARVKPRLPDFDVRRLLLSAIHTHNAPQLFPAFNWWTPAPGALSSAAYRAGLIDRLERAVVQAWQRRRPGGVSWALGHAAVGHCRRALYADGSAEMYGRTDRPDFIGLEGSEDPGVDLLFCWDARRRLTGLVVNLACPAQVMEATSVVTADFAGDLRRRLADRYGPKLPVLVQISPAGDQSPRDLARNYRGEPDMWNEGGVREIARRLEAAVVGACDAARDEARFDPEFRHAVQPLRLPLRRATPGEYREACRRMKALQAREPADPRSPRAAFNRFVAQVRANESKGGPGPYDSKLHDFVLLRNNEAVIARYRMQDAHPDVPVELHALRLGEAAFATNPFELYLDYGQRIRARSPATQAFLVQLAGDCLGYLPSARAVQGGGYGALIINGQVGPEGGDVLVDETLQAVNRLWKS